MIVRVRCAAIEKLACHPRMDPCVLIRRPALCLRSLQRGSCRGRRPISQHDLELRRRRRRVFAFGGLSDMLYSLCLIGQPGQPNLVIPSLVN